MKSNNKNFENISLMKILCYGDSNTWGYNPKDSSRFDESKRWTGILKKIFSNAVIIENGLNGRSILNINTCSNPHCALLTLRDDIKEFIPLDVIIFFLGINDAASTENSLKEIAEGMRKLIDISTEMHIEKNFKAPEIIIISPPEIDKTSDEAIFMELEINKVSALTEIFRTIATEMDVYFLDISKTVKTSSIDPFHLDEDGHKELSLKLAAFLKKTIVK
ncbi:MAG TPA: GDSL-type esterase/lipase family protein [Spirochaetota bacterium]|nr:hypothetical protein [Spirochaetota bacterium]HOQ12455.1 GDSL-type esterase/lipase family protein [Spirochaetota bacterium]